MRIAKPKKNLKQLLGRRKRYEKKNGLLYVNGKHVAVQAVESGTTFENIQNIVIFAKQKEAEAYAAKRDGNRKSHRRLW